MSEIAKNFEEIETRIAKAGKHWDVDTSATHIVAVSKKQPAERIQAALDCGHRLYGENRVQEAMERWGGDDGFLKSFPNVKLHLIGNLQTNKAKQAVQLFDCIETIDSTRLADAVQKECEKQGKEIECLIQVNTGEEGQKSGVTPDELEGLLKHCKEIGLKISGLMCIPPSDEPAGLHFAFLKNLAESYGLEKLSMGMSGDFEKALPLKPSYIRVGSSLFGLRPNE